MTLDEKLYKLRTDKGITQAKLADHLNVTRQTVSKWETGEAIPSTDNMRRLSTFYNVSLEYLVQADVESDYLVTQADRSVSDQPQESESCVKMEEHQSDVGKAHYVTRRWLILAATVAVLIFIFAVLWMTRPASNNISMDEAGKKEVSVLSEDSFDFTF